MALSDESRAAFMRAAALLARTVETAEECERIDHNAQRYADEGKWIPAFTAEQFPVVFYPNDPAGQALLAAAIRKAQARGELLKPAPNKPKGLRPLQWARWKGLPPIPTDSPLVHWLPDWLPREDAPPDRGRRVKRSALIADNVRRWPTVERDLQDAASNGLSAAARTERIGWWHEGSALEWARERNKVKEAAPALTELPARIHRMRG